MKQVDEKDALSFLTVKRLLQILGALLLIAGIACVALFAYAMFIVDSTVELHRGTLMGELLLRSRAVRAFPPDLIPGEKHYFYSPGEPTGKSANILLIHVPKYDPAMMQQCEEWFSQFGFAKTQSNLARVNVVLREPSGREARIEVDGNDIIINVEH
ncbi:hypothetical protein [Verrucomicrobium sp. BvORR106]|uniref:hypothetical protein n=1 Tax=Verrucomicrobium sp. BvORR106 TaxID=1403819 RepID=UPI00056E907E|nr:hypothetical protein [Verrucomicrobium sp. BvORR106]